MLVDSHCHLDGLDLSNYNSDLGLALTAAHKVGVEYFLSPGVDLEHFPQILAIAKKYSNVVVALAKHPTEMGRDPTMEELISLGQDSLVVAIGETGLDYAYAKSDKDKEYQKELFRTHIRAALNLKKPLIIHSREAARDILEILKQEESAQIGGVFHCFTDTLEVAQAAIDLNFYISFSGIITFKNAEKLREVARSVPLERILIETDAPYLAPVPMRGKPNEPAYLPYIAEFLAKLRGIPTTLLAKQTTANFFKLFK